MSSSSRMMATRQPMRMAVGLPSALATGCWPRGSSSGGGAEDQSNRRLPIQAGVPWEEVHRTHPEETQTAHPSH